MTKEESKRGGNRVNSGRKPLSAEDRRVCIRIYPKTSRVDALGGEDGLREKLNVIVEDMYQNKIISN